VYDLADLPNFCNAAPNSLHLHETGQGHNRTGLQLIGAGYAQMAGGSSALGWRVRVAALAGLLAVPAMAHAGPLPLDPARRGRGGSPHRIRAKASPRHCVYCCAACPRAAICTIIWPARSMPRISSSGPRPRAFAWTRAASRSSRRHARRSARSSGSPGKTSSVSTGSSMRCRLAGFSAGVGQNDVSGHTQFFRSFDRFFKIAGETAQMLTSVRRIAAGDNLSYLELDHNTAALSSVVRAAETRLSAQPISGRNMRQMPRHLRRSFRRRAPNSMPMRRLRPRPCPAARQQRRPGCKVAVHYLFQSLRALPPAQVYRSLILGFMMADADPRFVGVNIVMPEDAYLARRDYKLHMAMIRFLAAKYSKVRLTLHAGEVTLGQVPPEDLTDHIEQAVAVGAKRIGHGTGIAFEDQAEDTMARMAKEGIAVEINLTSNAVILGVKGKDHPLNLYRAHGVPVVLSTDDQGVLRSDMTD